MEAKGGGGRGAVLLQTQFFGTTEREYADSALKTVAARRLWRLCGGEAVFPARVGAHHTGDVN